MILLRRIGSVFLVPLLLAACASQQQPAPQSSAATSTAAPTATATTKPSTYLDAGAVDLLALLPAPPANDSPITRAEIELVLTLQREATPAAVARATSEERLTSAIFAEVLGPNFNDKALPRTAAFLKAAAADAGPLTNAAKDHFKRPRPPSIDRRVNPHEEPHASFGYPSGHSTGAMLWATLLAEMLPEKRNELRARAAAAGYSRIVLGVHFPSDVVAGLASGEAIGRAIIAAPRAKAALEDARQELRAAGFAIR
ncbi:MAG: acid phosphatase [Phycisphaerales bacterium]